MKEILAFIRNPKGILDLLNIFIVMNLVVFFGVKISSYFAIIVFVFFGYFIYEFLRQNLWTNFFSWLFLLLSLFPLGYSVYLIIKSGFTF